MTQAVTYALREALLLAVLLAAPPTLAVMLTGALMGALQTATQVKDASISNVPKVLAAFAALAAAGPWIGAQTVQFTRALLEALPILSRS